MTRLRPPTMFELLRDEFAKKADEAAVRASALVLDGDYQAAADAHDDSTLWASITVCIQAAIDADAAQMKELHAIELRAAREARE